MFVESVQKTTELTAYCLLQFILGLESINIFQSDIIASTSYLLDTSI